MNPEIEEEPEIQDTIREIIEAGNVPQEEADATDLAAYIERRGELIERQISAVQRGNEALASIISDEIRDLDRAHDGINEIQLPTITPQFAYGIGSFTDFANHVERRRSDNQCRHCGKPCTPESANQFTWEIVEGSEGLTGLYCGECRNECFQPCRACEEIHYTQAMHRIVAAENGHCIGYVCPECKEEYEDEYMGCARCGHLMLSSDESIIGGYCRNCAERIRGSDEIHLRDIHYDENLTDTDIKRGSTLKSLRGIGIELEVQRPQDQHTASAATLAVDSRIGIGTDNSINGNGLELRFPPAAGNKAEALVKNTCEKLQAAKFTVDASCGYHVHIDVSDLDDKQPGDQVYAVKNIWCLYLAFEDVIMSFLPPSRRTNNYCQSLRQNYNLDEIGRARNMDALERLWYRVANTQQTVRAKGDLHHQSRYRGINLHPMFAERHLEIRYHTGTLRTRRILEWANLHASIVDKCLGGLYFNIEHYNSVLTCMDLPAKTRELFKLVGLDERSQAYFLARQEKFYAAPKFTIGSEAKKAATEELDAEKEDLSIINIGRNQNRIIIGQ